MDKINILFFESGEGFGGSPKSLLILTKNLNKHAFNPIVLVFHKGPFVEQIEQLGIKVIQLKFFDVNKNVLYKLVKSFFGKNNMLTLNLKYYLDLFVNGVLYSFKCASIIKKEQIDIVHLNNGLFENLSALLAAKVSHKPIVAHVRGTEPLLFLEKFVCKWVKFYFVQNKRLINLWQGYVPRNRMIKVVNTVDSDLIPKTDPFSIRKELKIPSNLPIIGFVGRLVEGKGVDCFLKAASKIVNKKPSVKFLIVGSGPLETGLKDMATELGISKNVIFTGWRDDIYDITSCFDVLIQPTTTFPESFGNTILEAMTLSKPVIASRVGGSDEIVINGKTGFIVEPGNVEQLTEKIIVLLNNKKLARKMGYNGRKSLEKKYDAKKESLLYEKIYIKLAKRN